jgi:protein TonB
MRQQGIEGEVIAQFVVDTTGSIIPSTIKFVKATNDVFRDVVREALPALQFSPAEVGGRKVKQMLTMPFNFSLSK